MVMDSRLLLISSCFLDGDGKSLHRTPTVVFFAMTVMENLTPYSNGCFHEGDGDGKRSTPHLNLIYNKGCFHDGNGDGKQSTRHMNLIYSS